MPKLVLASTSPARSALLRQVGLHFEVVAPGVVEALDPAGDPLRQARDLAAAKARAVAALRPGAIVIGADQVLAVEGTVLGKPVGEGAARDQLGRLAHKRHELTTAIHLVAPGTEIADAETTVLTVRALSAGEIDRYVATGEWQGCAGGYRIEGRGLALFERIEGDPTNVLGLPMPRLLGHLRRLGVPLF